MLLNPAAVFQFHYFALNNNNNNNKKNNKNNGVDCSLYFIQEDRLNTVQMHHGSRHDVWKDLAG